MLADDIALQADGKILLAGFASTSPSLTDTTVVRYNADGSLDLTFGGGDGIATINTNPTGSDAGRGIVVQPDGRILVVGNTTAAIGDIALSRLNADGSLDLSFGGGDGIVTTPIAAGLGNDTGANVTLQSDGKILVSGMTTTPTGGGELALVRYLSDGSLDTDVRPRRLRDRGCGCGRRRGAQRQDAGRRQDRRRGLRLAGRRDGVPRGALQRRRLARRRVRHERNRDDGRRPRLQHYPGLPGGRGRRSRSNPTARSSSSVTRQPCPSGRVWSTSHWSDT